MKYGVAALALASGLALAPGPARGADEAVLEALVVDERIDEISGLAASRRHDDVLWVHNDSDRPAELHALGTDGALRATVRVRGKRNIDWEDLAAFEWDGKPYLLVADVGDNGGLRRELQLHAIEEPAALEDGEVPVAWTVRFRWPDGPRDCEAVAVDVREGMVYLISKKRVPPELFRVALRPARREVQVAERIGSLAGVLQPTPADLQRNPVYGRYRSQITAADISPDGSLFAVLNYRTAYVWGRHPAGWGAAVRSPPRALGFPWVPQAEALGFDVEGRSLWVGSERLPAPLLRLPLQGPIRD